MTIIKADLHIHSRYSLACSKELSIPKLEHWARVKGLDILGTGDFTHPDWLHEIEKFLTPDSSGFLKSSQGFNFVLQAEISNIWRQDGKTRKVHHIILAPDIPTVKKINAHLASKGKTKSDGRPTFGSYSAEALLKDLFSISEDIEVIPAHIWTPWFSLFGDKSGFDDIHECYKSQIHRIHALETGLSSDPPMNRRLHQLDAYNLVSNSDTHSFWPWKLGREFNVFDIEPTYQNLLYALRNKDKGLQYTVEVDPNFGKYHHAGHRKCSISLEPDKAAAHKYICPVCKKRLTVGVADRVMQLSDIREDSARSQRTEFRYLLPLSEVIAAFYSTSPSTKKVWTLYNRILKHSSSELGLLLADENSAAQILIKSAIDPDLAELILKNIRGNLVVSAGYDGVFGRIQN